MDFITAFSYSFISYWDYIHLPLSLLILPLLILVSLLPLFTFMVHPLYKTRYGRRPAIFVFLSLSSFAQHDDPQLHHILCVTSTILFFFTSYSYSTAYMHFFCSFTPMSTQANSTTYLRWVLLWWTWPCKCLCSLLTWILSCRYPEMAELDSTAVLFSEELPYWFLYCLV